MATNEQAANYKRDRDRALRHEADLPPTGPTPAPTTGPMPEDLDRLFGVGQPPRSESRERRVRETWLK
jgi:hypothetical protein